MTPIVEVKNLVREFDGVRALNGVSFSIERGQVVGFIGANGAGKTTTMRLMASLDMPDSGSVSINGMDTREHAQTVRRSIGWMPDSYGTYDNVSVIEYLDFYARAYLLKGQERAKRLQEVMSFTDLDVMANRPINGLSKGMAQRLFFGRTLLHDPDILILDEPAAGLDPKARVELKNLVLLLAKENKTIFISSHILSELTEMCDSLLFIDKGKIIHQGATDSLDHGQQPHLDFNIMTLGSNEALKNWLECQALWSFVSESNNSVLARFDSLEAEQLAQQLKQMIDAGIRVVDFHRVSRKIEDVFIDMLNQQEGQS